MVSSSKFHSVSLNKFKTKINSCTAYHYHCWLCKNMLGEKDSVTLFHRFLRAHAFVIFFLDHLHYFYFFSKSIKILETSESTFWLLLVIFCNNMYYCFYAKVKLIDHITYHSAGVEYPYLKITSVSAVFKLLKYISCAEPQRDMLSSLFLCFAKKMRFWYNS